MDLWAAVLRLMISIHALRVEGDLQRAVFLRSHVGISIHALRVEGDGGTGYCIYLGDDDFYPRPPGGGRPSETNAANSASDAISIHALRVEGDSKNGQSFRLFLRKREKNLPL